MPLLSLVLAVSFPPGGEVAYSASAFGALPVPQEQAASTEIVRRDLIRSLKANEDGDWVPDHLGEAFEVEGLITFTPYSAGGAEQNRAYLADASGGIRLVFSGPDSLPPFQLWDSIRVQGVLEQYRAMEYLAVSSYEVLGAGTPREPSDHLIETLNGEFHTGELVRIEGKVVFGEDRVLLEDRTGRIRIYFRSAIVPEGGIGELLYPGRMATVVGVLEQNDRTDPPTSGYRITPRSRDDVRMLPPDRGWMVWAGLLVLSVLVGLAAWYRSWLARKESARWKDYSARLAEEMRERERAEEANTLMETRLREAYKLESVGRLAGGVAHEFNNLLTVILGAVSMELDGGGLSAETRRSLEEVETASKRARHLTEQLVDFSRERPTVPGPLDLWNLVQVLVPVLERILGGRVTLDIGGGPGAWAEADEGQIEQVLLNLVQNARDVLPEGGKVSITVGTVDVTEHGELGPGSSPGPFAFVSVGDTGPGIEQKALDRIFDPFFSTKGIGQGVGLGLSTAYGMVNQSGGYLTVDSRPGAGATFSVFLPLLQQ